MIETVVPACVAAVETSADAPESELYAAEREHVATASPARRAEFAAVRHCARRAMAELGVPPTPLLPGDGGAPVWPAGVVGSMTHCAGYRAAAVARSAQVSMLGIDAEPHATLPAGVLDRAASPAEHEHLAELLAARDDICWDRLLFAVKESVYKACFPRGGERLGFADACVRFDPDVGTFAARVSGARALTGRFALREGLVLAGVSRFRTEETGNPAS